jgi:RNA polymerase sigma-70 factor, ECF subfamily
VGDLEVAEDAVQDACLVALDRWPTAGVPANPAAWLAGVARHKALDRLRRESRRVAKETEATRMTTPGDVPAEVVPDDELALIFLCCHPSLDPGVRVALTLRTVCGLATAEIAAAFLVQEPTMAQRLVRAKRKIRQAGISFGVPEGDFLSARLATVLRVVYLVFTEGHRASGGTELVRGALCDTAIRLARVLVRLLPGEPEAAGLLALLLLTDARRDARLGADGALVLLQDQDRTRWKAEMIGEGEALVERALRMGRPGPYQIHAAIAACHSAALVTDWPQIAALYGELLRHEPSPVVEANRAVAVGMAQGPEAGLRMLENVRDHPRLAGWPQLHIARAELLRRLDRHDEAEAAYRTALSLGLPPAERAHIERRIAET